MFNFLVCTRVNLDTTQHTIYWVSSVQHSGHTRSSSVSRAQYAESVICETQLQSRDYMTSAKGFRALDNEICRVSPRLRTKGSGDNQDCSDSGPAPWPSCRTSLSGETHYLTWEIKDNKYQHQLLSDLFAVVELSGAEPTTLTPQGQSKS